MTLEEDKAFYAQLLKDIPYFHRLYAKYHDADYLGISKTLGQVSATLKRKIETYDYNPNPHLP